MTTYSNVADTSIIQLALREIISTVFTCLQKDMKNTKSYKNHPNTALSPTSRLWYQSNYHDALQAHMHPLHRLGITNTIENKHKNYQTPIKNGTANGAASNAYLTAPYVLVKIKCIIMKYRNGTLYNQKHAVWSKHSIRLTCPLCPQLDSALHMFSGRQHTQIRNMVTERHNLACSMIFKAISKTGYVGSCFVCMGIGSRERQAMQNFHNPNTGETRIILKWLIPPRFSDENRLTSSRPDAVLVAMISVKKAKIKHQNV